VSLRSPLPSIGRRAARNARGPAIGRGISVIA